MKNKSLRHLMVRATVSLLVGFSLPTPSLADTGTVLPGFDLFQTVSSGTTFGGFNFQGVPLGTFDFGAAAANSGSPSPYIGPSGNVYVGNTDTIMQRLDTVNTPGSTRLQLVALQLQSTIPAYGGQYGYITLDPSKLSLDTGTMTINNTFTSEFDVYFDLWAGAIGGTGTLVTSGACHFTTEWPVAWTHDAPSDPGVLKIPGVNYELAGGTDTSEDFWPSGAITHVAPLSDAIHTIPEPSVLTSSLVLLGIGTVGLLVREWRRRTAKA